VSVEVAGQRLFVRRSGTPGAAPAVYVHGLGGSSTNWTDLMALLAERFDGHAVDLPGFGNSAPPVAGSYSLDSHAGAIAGYIEQEIGEAVHLLGNSLGGAVTARLAATRPELVASLTFISAALPSYRPQVGSDPRMPLLLVPGLSKVTMRALSRHSAERRTRAIVNLCFADPDAVSPVRFAEAVREMRKRRAVAWYDDALTLSLRGLVRAYLQPGREGLWHQVGELRMPVLLIHGTSDRLVPVAVSQRAARMIQGSRLVLVESAGHVAQIEAPYAVAEAFLAMNAAMDAAAPMRESRG
jgi:pimeloyl-ACP methyl ester carboxylesterase